MIVIIFGVSGAGKTTVGKLLARELGWRFIEVDDFHPAANIEKMRSGRNGANMAVSNRDPDCKRLLLACFLERGDAPRFLARPLATLIKTLAV